MLDKLSTRLRFFLLQFMLIIGMVALYVDGYLTRIFAGDSKYFCAVVIGLGLIGLWHVYRERYDNSFWFANILVRIGVIGMIVGCSGGLTAVAGAIASGADPTKVLGVFLGGMGIAFYVSLCALSSNVWLEANMYLLRGVTDETA